MPELPEVENIRLQLERFLIGHRIESVEVNYKKCFQGDKGKVVGGKVKSVRRFGKALVIDLDDGYSIALHVKMTGQPIYRGSKLKKTPRLSEKVLGGVPGKHTQVIFNLDRGGRLYYNDVRKFGWIKIIESSKLKVESEFLKNLGPEPVVNPKNPPEDPLTLEKFEEILRRSSRAIKVVLMDQKKLSGVGNIYANDALWHAKIAPRRKAGSLKREEVKALFNAMIKVLRKGLDNNGASENSFVLPDGTEGRYQHQALAYGREGWVCKRCKKAKIKKVKLSGRGTYFCPRCQT